MAGRPVRSLVSVLLLVLLVSTAFWWYLPDVKRLYWDLRSTSSGPERHGPTTVRTVPSETPYDRWLQDADGRIPLVEALMIQDLGTIALKPWPQMGEGINGLYLRFADYQITDGRILELPAGGQTLPQRHLFEMGVYAVGGPGHTLFFRQGREPLRLDWQAEALFSVPLNARYQHFNDSDQAIRLLAVTSFPFAMNASASESFVLDNRHHFEERFDGESNYFSVVDRLRETRTRTNFVADLLSVTLDEGYDRGPGRMTMGWPMAGNTVIDMHVSEIPASTRMKSHRHTSDAFILILGGEGYSLAWSGDNLRHRIRVDWQKNTLFAPPTYWYHQHFNSGEVASRHLAINSPTLVRNLGLRFYDQIEEDSPEIRAEWESALNSMGKR